MAATRMTTNPITATNKRFERVDNTRGPRPLISMGGCIQSFVLDADALLPPTNSIQETSAFRQSVDNKLVTLPTVIGGHGSAWVLYLYYRHPSVACFSRQTNVGVNAIVGNFPGFQPFHIPSVDLDDFVI